MPGNGRRMRTRLAGLVTSALLAIPLLATAPAEAATWNHRDAANDMTRSVNPPRLDPRQTAGDIRRVRYNHARRTFVAKITVGRIAKRASRSYTVMIATSAKRRYIYTGTIRGTEHSYAEFRNWRTNKRVRCNIRARELWRTRTLTVRIPRKCLGNPKWVRTDASASVQNRNGHWYDYAHRDRTAGYFTWSPRIRRG